MNGYPWFKMPAADLLMDGRLDELDNEEFRTYWVMLAKASLTTPRWIAPEISMRHLARRCSVTPERAAVIVERLAAYRLIEVDDLAETYAICDPERYEGRAPSDAAEATRERKRLQRERERRLDDEGRF